MTARKRVLWVTSLVAFLFMTTGCANTTLRLVDEEIARPNTDIHKESGQKIEGYLLHDGTREDFKGRVRLAQSDSLVFWSVKATSGDGEFEDLDPLGDGSGSPAAEMVIEAGPTFAISAVKALDIYDNHTGGTVSILVVSTVVVLGVAFLAALSSGWD